MFRFAYPVVLLLLLVVAGWLLFALWRKPSGITYSMTSKMAGLAGGWEPGPGEASLDPERMHPYPFGLGSGQAPTLQRVSGCAIPWRGYYSLP